MRSPTRLVPALLVAVLLPASGLAGDGPRSGYLFAAPETRAMQDDAFANPGLFWLEDGERRFAQAPAAGAPACRDCHDADALRGTATTYPRIGEDGVLRNLEGQINRCRTRRQDVPALAYDSDSLLALTLFVRHQSRGLPMAVATDGAAAPAWQRGRDLYHRRRGQMNLACTQCHDQRVGERLRGETISEGQINGFPAYLLRWGRLGSAHRRFRYCDDQAVAEPLAAGSADYLALELYVAARGNGLPVEAPAVRR